MIDAIKPAVKQAVDMWKLSAHFSDLTIMAVSAIGAPGCLDGPELESHIRIHPKIQSLSGLARDMANGIAEGFSDNFFLWQNAVTVPWLAVVSGLCRLAGTQSRHPTPNVPMPLISCVSEPGLPGSSWHSEVADAITSGAARTPEFGETAFINRVAAGAGARSFVLARLGPGHERPRLRSGAVLRASLCAGGPGGRGHESFQRQDILMAAPSLNPVIV